MFRRQNTRSLLYALIMALGIVFLQQLAANGITSYLYGTGILALVLLLELFTAYYYSRRKLFQFNLPQIDEFSRLAQFIHHLVLPMSLHFAISGLVFTTDLPGLVPIFFGISLGLYYFLFVNIRAYYSDKFKLEQGTHFIFDTIKIFTFFAITVTTLNLANLFGFNFYILTGLVFSYGSLLTFLTLLNNRNSDWLAPLIVVLSGLCLGYLTASIATLAQVNTTISAFLATICFYIFNALLHHELNRTLRVNVALEYLLVGLVSFLVVLLLT